MLTIGTRASRGLARHAGARAVMRGDSSRCEHDPERTVQQSVPRQRRCNTTRATAAERARTSASPPPPPETDTPAHIAALARRGSRTTALAHLVKDAIARAGYRALQTRLAEHAVSIRPLAVPARSLGDGRPDAARTLAARRASMEPTTFAALKAMESAGLRRAAGSWRAIAARIYIFLTAKGRALGRRLIPLAEEVNRIAVRGVPTPTWRRRGGPCLRCSANLARDEASPGQRGQAHALDPRTRPARAGGGRANGSGRR